MTVWDEIAERLKDTARSEARQHARPARRFRVTDVDPGLVLEAINGDEVLEEGDPDFDIDASVQDMADVGDLVIVVRTADGDYLATGLVNDG